MRSLKPLILLAPLVLAGCLGNDASESVSSASTDVPAAEAPIAVPEPVVQVFAGRALGSAATPLAHQKPTEPIVADYQREGTVLEVLAAPTSLKFELAWTSPSPTTEMWLMIDAPVPGEDVMPTFASARAKQSPLCVTIPAEALAQSVSEWAIMVHNVNAAGVDFELTVTSVGGDAHLATDRYHMEVEDDSKQRDVREPFPCA